MSVCACACVKMHVGLVCVCVCVCVCKRACCVLVYPSPDKPAFMMDCEKNYSMWTFSGGFRTWVKMSLVMTSGKKDDAVEFRQEVAASL